MVRKLVPSTFVCLLRFHFPVCFFETAHVTTVKYLTQAPHMPQFLALELIEEVPISESWPLFAVFYLEDQAQCLFSFYLPSFGGGSGGEG